MLAHNYYLNNTSWGPSLEGGAECQEGREGQDPHAHSRYVNNAKPWS